MAVVEVGPVEVRVHHGFVIVPVRVRHRHDLTGVVVIVVAVVVAVRVGVGQRLMRMTVGVLTAEDEQERRAKDDRRSEVTGRQRFPEQSHCQRDPGQRGRCKEEVRTRCAEALGGGHVEHDARSVRERTEQEGQAGGAQRRTERLHVCADQ